MSELAGYFFTGTEATVQSARRAILLQLGTPTQSDLIRWPEFTWEVFGFYKQPWPASVHLSLGRDGVQLLEKFLRYIPGDRTVYAFTQQ
jgi:hypothetical protein